MKEGFYKGFRYLEGIFHPKAQNSPKRLIYYGLWAQQPQDVSPWSRRVRALPKLLPEALAFRALGL